MKVHTKKASVLLIALMAIILVSSSFFLPVKSLVEGDLIFQAATAQTLEDDFDGPLNYGYHIGLFSIIELPAEWYLSYTMGVYLMNSSGTGYYIGFHQYRGEAQIYISPVSNGIYYGLDGQPYHTGWQISVISLFALQVTLDYNSTTGEFQMRQNGAIIIDNNFSGLNITKWKLENPLGRDQISGSLRILAVGPDHVDGSYDNPVSNGIGFHVVTDNTPVPDDGVFGGSMSWNSYTLPMNIGELINGTTGYYQGFGLMNSVTVTATPQPGFVFNGWYIGTDFTGHEYFPAGFYTGDGRLIASANLYHVFASEAGRVVHETGGYDVPGAISGAIVQYLTANPDAYLNAILPEGWYWQNATGYYRMFQITRAMYDSPIIWQEWLTNYNHLVPQTVGIDMNNPAFFWYQGSNYTIIASFVSINNNPNDIPGVQTSPTPQPSGGPGPNFDFGFNFNASVNGLIMSIVGAIMVFIGVLLLMKAHAAWMPASIILVVGFLLTMAGQPGLVGLIAFSIEILMYSFFLYGTNEKRSK